MLTTYGKAALKGPRVGLTSLKQRVTAMLKRMIGKLAEPRMTYEEARASLERHAHNARLFLAARSDVEPEILYYLASDDAVDVRRLVAANPATPQQANKILASDVDASVRLELARKMARQVCGTDASMTPRARALATEVAERLALDADAGVRAAVGCVQPA